MNKFNRIRSTYPLFAFPEKRQAKRIGERISGWISDDGEKMNNFNEINTLIHHHQISDTRISANHLSTYLLPVGEVRGKWVSEGGVR